MSTTQANWSVQIEGIRNPSCDETVAAGLTKDQAHDLAQSIRRALKPGRRLLIGSPNETLVISERKAVTV